MLCAYLQLFISVRINEFQKSELNCKYMYIICCGCEAMHSFYVDLKYSCISLTHTSIAVNKCEKITKGK